MYFVESVSTLSTFGKTRKAELLQKMSRRFEHTLIVDESALDTFIHQFEVLVAVCNKKYKGKTVYLRHNSKSGHIYACKGVPADGYIFMISYVPVVQQMPPHEICNVFSDAVWMLDKRIFRKFCEDS